MKIVLNDIIELVEMLKEKINKYSDRFSKNETLVRYALIDPFLRILGWDTGDPKQLIPEYTTKNGRADYAFFINNKLIAFLGAKKLGTDEDLTQQIAYCINEGVAYFITSDGNKWTLYSLKEATKPISDKIITNWNILNDNPSEIAFRALTISNLNAFGIQPQKPIFKPDTGEKIIGNKEEFTRKNIERIILEILNDANGPLTRKEIVNEVSQRVKLGNKEKEILKSGLSRWEATVRWTVTTLSKKGLIKSSTRNSWVITENGREILKNSGIL